MWPGVFLFDMILLRFHTVQVCTYPEVIIIQVGCLFPYFILVHMNSDELYFTTRCFRGNERKSIIARDQETRDQEKGVKIHNAARLRQQTNDYVRVRSGHRGTVINDNKKKVLLRRKSCFQNEETGGTYL